jgi:hypothetical protein
VTRTGNGWLIAAGIGSALAALLHLAVIVGGPDWYRMFGAGERMARAAERGALFPVLLTLGIAMACFVWSAYAFAGADVLRRLPLMRLVLVLISLGLLGRGLAILWPNAWRPDLTYGFKLWSSLVVLALAMCFALGTWQAWPNLSAKRRF